MVQIQPFAVEQWMNEYETRCAFNLAETCVESMSVDQLLDLTGTREAFLDELMALRLTYGAIEGTERLRTAIAALYEGQGADRVLVAHGAIGANHLLYLTLIEAGDRVVSIVPNYQQHYSIPESLGADVHRFGLRENDNWGLDLESLRDLVAPGTKVVTLSNPNNPTGSVLDRGQLEELVKICDRVGAWLLCDEVYRGVDQEGAGTTVSVVDLYDRGISVGSMSKAFSLAGLRLGWVVAEPGLLDSINIHRDYNTISVGMVDDLLSSIALEHADRVLDRNRALVRANNATVADWVDATPEIEWVRPAGGTTALLRYSAPLSSRELCVGLVEATGVMLTPGSALDVEGYLRIGYANNPNVLAAGLPLLGDYLATLA